MAAAGLTPRVRIVVLCDGIRESKTERGVFNLKGVRQSIAARAFPFANVHFRLFMALSSPRPGEYPVYVRVTNDRTDTTIFHGKVGLKPTFRENNDVETTDARITCTFPEPGRYIIQVSFFQEHGSDVLKGELPFSVAQESE